MRISSDVCGYYDWAPVPSDTQITDADVRSLNVKQMSDGSWHMRIEQKQDTHHDVGIHEQQICNRMAALSKLGRETSRENVVADILRESYRHHIHTKHLTAIHVVDDGPDESLYRETLAQHDLTPAQVEAAVAQYTDSADLAAYLNTVFKTAKTKPAKKGVK